MMGAVSLIEAEFDGEDEILVNDSETWVETEFEVALDSGSVVHVCSAADALGYKLEPSPGSKRGQKFIMGDGGRTANLGQKALNLTDPSIGKENEIKSIFQIAKVTRPLMSVGKICDEGMSVTFDKNVALVVDKGGRTVCKFERQAGGLYVAKLRLRAPAGFGRQE